MADKRLTQSPRQMRESTNDAEKYAKGDVRLGMSDPDAKDAVNAGVPEASLNQRDASGWPTGKIFD